MQNIYLVRHGETEWNKKLLYQGQRDIPLNEQGVLQAGLVAAHLEQEQIDVIYSSPLARARKTATLIGERHGLEPCLEEGLMEIDFGAWEGLNYSDLDQGEKLVAERWFKNPASANIPGGEPYSAFNERVLQSFAQIRKNNQNIAVVTHAGVIRVIVAAVLEMPAAAVVRLRLFPASLTILLYDDWENPYLQVYNETCFLNKEF